ncbi:MAG: hypothetical protein ABL872_13790 [Lacibacter sp.]
MKKIVSTAALIFTAFFANAQGGEPAFDRNIFNAVSVIFVVILFMVFIINVLKMFLENRMKHKIIDKGVSESAASSLLQTTPKNDQLTTIKWVCILAGIGGGLMIVNYTQPLGIHSLATMAFSISVSFLVYYFFAKFTSK